jgi:hypothetical protein
MSAQSTCAGSSRRVLPNSSNGASSCCQLGLKVTSRTWCSAESTSAMCQARIAGPAMRSAIASPVSTSTRRGRPKVSSIPNASSRISCAAR